MVKELIRFLKMNDVEYKEGLPLASISPIRIGAEADIVAFPDDEAKLVLFLKFLENTRIKYKISGRMSNLLPPDEKYSGVLIRTDRINAHYFDGNMLSVSCGASIPYISSLTQAAGLGGFERLSGIPGSIGGAAVGNAGAFGREISDLIIDIRVCDIIEKSIYTLPLRECSFSYRSSSLKNRDIIVLSARFRLCYSDKSSIKAEMNRCKDIRRATQPIGAPSLGSVFKRPSAAVSAAELIDKCGLKGYGIGGAQISEKHAGFIVNAGRATAKDYILLSEFAAKCVYEKYGIALEREIEIM